ncbi:MAG: hypothetical protein ACLTZM_19390 [Ruminococcus sp.]
MKNLMGIMEQSIQQFRESNDRFTALSSLVKEHVVEEKNQEIKDLYENLQYKDKNIQELKEKLAKKEQEIRELKKKQKNTGKKQKLLPGKQKWYWKKKAYKQRKGCKK